VETEGLAKMAARMMAAQDGGHHQDGRMGPGAHGMPGLHVSHK
jgi:hypothetical protein